MRKIGIVLIGWHYPSQPYQSLVKQVIPEGWEAEFFVIGHRLPEQALDERENKLSQETKLSSFDKLLYETPVTLDFLKNIGWNYIQGISGNEWEGANLFLSKVDYREYECLLFAGDDFLLLRDKFFTEILNDDIDVYGNYKEGKSWKGKKEVISYNDWLVLSNSIHSGRQAIRGSFEVFKTEVFDLLGGKFPLHDRVIALSKKLNGNVKTLSTSHNALTEYNTQFWEFMNVINRENIYHRIKFLSNKYRVSKYVIEGERGLISNNNTYSGEFLEGIKKYHGEFTK